jgi:hypothetical protein
MNTRHLRIAAGAGDPDDVLTLRIDVVTAAKALVAAVDAKGLTETEWHAEVEKATDDVYRKAKNYMHACARRK